MQQSNQEVIRMVQAITGETSPNVVVKAKTALNNSGDVITKTNGFFFLRFKGTDFIGAVNASFRGLSVKQILNEQNVDTGDIFVICDEIDAIGIDENSGEFTMEGWEYTSAS